MIATLSKHAAERDGFQDALMWITAAMLPNPLARMYFS